MLTNKQINQFSNETDQLNIKYTQTYRKTYDAEYQNNIPKISSDVWIRNLTDQLGNLFSSLVVPT